MQLSNVPEVRPARRLLFLATGIFVVLCLLNAVTTFVAFADGDGDRWVNLARLIGNILVGLLLWRGYVALAALAERASLYKQALDDELPRLREAVDRQRAEAAASSARSTTGTDDPSAAFAGSPTRIPDG